MSDSHIDMENQNNTKSEFIRKDPQEKFRYEPNFEKLVGKYVKEYSPPLHKLGMLLYHNPDISHKVVSAILCESLSQHNCYHPKSNIIISIFQTALKEFQKYLSSIPLVSNVNNASQVRLFHWIKQLGKIEKSFFFLYYFLSIDPKLIAKILRVSDSAVNAQIELFQNNLFYLFTDQSKQIKEKDGAAIESYVRLLLFENSAPLSISAEELEKYTDQILACVSKRITQLQHVHNIRKNAFIVFSFIGIVILLLGTGFFLWRGKSLISIPALIQTSFQVKGDNLPAPLTRHSSSDEIKARMLESSDLWKIIWADIQITDYGPDSYIGPAKSYRGQVWIKQPDQSITLFGLLGQKPNSVLIQNGEDILYENPVAGESYQKNISRIRSSSLFHPKIEQQIFPEQGPWFQQEGAFKPRDNATFSSRRCIILDWINSEGQIQSKLWVDVIYGLLIKRQDFAVNKPEMIIYEMIISDIRFDNETPDILIEDWLDLKNLDLRASNERQIPGKGIVTPTPTPGSKLIERKPLVIEPAPPGFNPNQSKLTFQYQQDKELVNLQSGFTEIQTELFADGYYLGRIQFGLPWGLRCQRAPDGRRIVYINASDGTTAPDYTLRWFSLENPQVQYQGLTQYQISDFAISPDSRWIAVFAKTNDDSQNGIFLMDLATGEYEQLLELYSAESLVWRPDGEYLAFFGQMNEIEDLAPMVLHTNTGLITHQIQMNELNTAVFERWPVFAWKVKFPKQEMGMQTCADTTMPYSE